VLLRKLALLDEWTAERRRAAAFYAEELDGVGDLVLPPVPVGSEPVWHLYPVCTEQPVPLQDALRVRGIGTGRHYPEPPCLSEAYSSLGHRRGEFPVADRVADQNVTLPMFPGITDEQLAAVVDAMRGFFGSH